MKEIALQVQKRETGKQNIKTVRNEGFVPGIFYAKGLDNINIMAKPLALRPIVYTSMTRVISLQVEGESDNHICFLKDVTFDPVTDEITHFDLQGITPGQKLTVEVPFKLTGQPIGVRQGGKFMQTLHKIKIKCLPKDMVEFLPADISGLNMGDVLYLKDINTENLEIELPEDTVIARVSKPRGGN